MENTPMVYAEILDAGCWIPPFGRIIQCSDVFHKFAPGEFTYNRENIIRFQAVKHEILGRHNKDGFDSLEYLL